MYIYHTFITHPSVDGHLSWFHVLATVMKIRVHISCQRYIPRGAIAWLYGSYIFCFSKNLWYYVFGENLSPDQFSCSVVSHSFLTPWTVARQASLSVIISQSLLKLMSIESVMPFNHLILCCPLLLPSIFPRIWVFSNKSALHIRWPKLEFQLQHQSFQWIPRIDFL